MTAGPTPSGARQWFGTLLVAWTLVASCALLLASAWYNRTGDLQMVIAYLGASFVVGLGLFLAIAAANLAGRTGAPRAEADAPTRTSGPRRRRDSFHRDAAGAHDAPRPPPTVTTQELHPDLRTGGVLDRVTVKAHPEEDDLADFHRTRLERRHARAAVLVMGTAGAIAWAKLLVPQLTAVDPASIVPLASLAGCFVYLGLLLSEPRRRARRDHEHARPAVYTLGPLGIEMAAPGEHDRYLWTSIAAVRETRRLMLLRTREGRDLVIPKRGVDEARLERVRDVLRTHLIG